MYKYNSSNDVDTVLNKIFKVNTVEMPIHVDEAHKILSSFIKNVNPDIYHLFFKAYKHVPKKPPMVPNPNCDGMVISTPYRMIKQNSLVNGELRAGTSPGDFTVHCPSAVLKFKLSEIIPGNDKSPASYNIGYIDEKYIPPNVSDEIKQMYKESNEHIKKLIDVIYMFGKIMENDKVGCKTSIPSEKSRTVFKECSVSSLKVNLKDENNETVKCSDEVYKQNKDSDKILIPLKIDNKKGVDSMFRYGHKFNNDDQFIFYEFTNDIKCPVAPIKAEFFSSNDLESQKPTLDDLEKYFTNGTLASIDIKLNGYQNYMKAKAAVGYKVHLIKSICLFTPKYTRVKDSPEEVNNKYAKQFSHLFGKVGVKNSEGSESVDNETSTKGIKIKDSDTEEEKSTKKVKKVEYDSDTEEDEIPTKKSSKTKASEEKSKKSSKDSDSDTEEDEIKPVKKGKKVEYDSDTEEDEIKPTKKPSKNSDSDSDTEEDEIKPVKKGKKVEYDSDTEEDEIKPVKKSSKSKVSEEKPKKSLKSKASEEKSKKSSKDSDSDTEEDEKPLPKKVDQKKKSQKREIIYDPDSD